MTKSALLSAISSAYDYVATERDITDAEQSAVGLKQFAVSTWDVSGESLISREIRFFTNTDESEAWWFGGSPITAPTQSFRDMVMTYLDGVPAIDAYVIESETGNHARVRVMVSGVEKIGYVTDTAGTLSHIVAN